MVPRYLLVLLALAAGLRLLLRPGAAQEAPADKVSTMPELGRTSVPHH